MSQVGDYDESDPRAGETVIEREERMLRLRLKNWLQPPAVEGEPPPDSPPLVKLAFKSVADTLEGAWLLAQVQFGPSARPEHAVGLLSAIEAERSRLEAKFEADKVAAASSFRAQKNLVS